MPDHSLRQQIHAAEQAVYRSNARVLERTAQLKLSMRLRAKTLGIAGIGVVALACLIGPRRMPMSRLLTRFGGTALALLLPIVAPTLAPWLTSAAGRRPLRRGSLWSLVTFALPLLFKPRQRAPR